MPRARFVYRPGHPRASAFGMVNVDELGPESLREPGRVDVVSDLYMDGTISPIDGADIGTRKKRREYMKLHGLADFDDFKGVWAKAAHEREHGSPADNKARREAVEKAIHQLQQGHKPRRVPGEYDSATGQVRFREGK